MLFKKLLLLKVIQHIWPGINWKHKEWEIIFKCPRSKVMALGLYWPQLVGISGDRTSSQDFCFLGHLFHRPGPFIPLACPPVLEYQICLPVAARSLPFFIFGLALKPGAFLSWTISSRKLLSFSSLVPLPHGVVHFGEQYLSAWNLSLGPSFSALSQSWSEVGEFEV